MATDQQWLPLCHREGQVPHQGLLRRCLHGHALEGDHRPPVAEVLLLLLPHLLAPLSPPPRCQGQWSLQPLQAYVELLHAVRGVAAVEQLRPRAHKGLPARAGIDEAVHSPELATQVLSDGAAAAAAGQARRPAGAEASRGKVGGEFEEGGGLRRAEEGALRQLHQERDVAPLLCQVADVEDGLLHQVQLEGLPLEHAHALRVRLQAHQVPLKLSFHMLEGDLDVAPLLRLHAQDCLQGHEEEHWG
mmetsp:Transcript_54876/g.160131  ORF Transcript_54876/g.160131 Transcript_54876/m.160131 type:complete len:246 (+) Transcript_54876:669-1406(+)